ncbi:MAG: hypothetical protein COA79_15040 [Planctomycetota bacterium]|nr:MAG: hypothetical protein COA79_15040 [Planctomycetota bacterium]
MSAIKPFKGFTPTKESASKVASLPYDVMNSEEAREITKDNPLSFLRVVKSEVDFPSDADTHSDEVYNKGSENLQQLIADGNLVQSEKPVFYLYRQIMGDVTQIGLVAGASVDEYDTGLIKKHEHTRKVKEDDRAKHVNILNANTGPVFLTYQHKAEIDDLVASIITIEPAIDFTADDSIQHTLWNVNNDETIDKFIELFNDVPALYVADGHHRSAAASRVKAMRVADNKSHSGDEPYNHFLSVIFPDNQLFVMDYNRVLKTLNGNSVEDLKAKIAESFDLTLLDIDNAKDAKPERRTEFAMYLNDAWYRLKTKENLIDRNDPVNSLDVALLQNLLLQPILGIEDPKTSNDIDFVGGIRGLSELEKRCHDDCQVAFALYPTGIDQLIAIADAGEVMPPKSTWFEPKLRSGMIVKSLATE